MTTSIIIATFENPKALHLAIEGIAHQTGPIQEIIFADDGSSDETHNVIRAFAEQTTYPVRHMWHPRNGIQKAGIANGAIAASQGEHILFLDGDCIPDTRWLADHSANADGETIWQGRRVLLKEPLSSATQTTNVAAGELEAWWTRDRLKNLRTGEMQNFHLSVRIPQPIVRLFKKRKGLMGCNFSAPRAILDAVNGYDAGWVGAQHLCEDLDLEVRLRKSGARLQPLLHAANVFHVWHPPRVLNKEILQIREDRWQIDSTIAADGIREAKQRIEQGHILDRLTAQ